MMSVNTPSMKCDKKITVTVVAGIAVTIMVCCLHKKMTEMLTFRGQ